MKITINSNKIRTPFSVTNSVDEKRYKFSESEDYISIAYDTDTCWDCSKPNYNFVNSIVTIDLNKGILEGDKALVNEWKGGDSCTWKTNCSSSSSSFSSSSSSSWSSSSWSSSSSSWSSSSSHSSSSWSSSSFSSSFSSSSSSYSSSSSSWSSSSSSSSNWIEPFDFLGYVAGGNDPRGNDTTHSGYGFKIGYWDGTPANTSTNTFTTKMKYSGDIPGYPASEDCFLDGDGYPNRTYYKTTAIYNDYYQKVLVVCKLPRISGGGISHDAVMVHLDSTLTKVDSVSLFGISTSSPDPEPGDRLFQGKGYKDNAFYVFAGDREGSENPTAITKFTYNAVSNEGSWTKEIGNISYKTENYTRSVQVDTNDIVFTHGNNDNEGGSENWTKFSILHLNTMTDTVRHNVFTATEWPLGSGKTMEDYIITESGHLIYVPGDGYYLFSRNESSPYGGAVIKITDSGGYNFTSSFYTSDQMSVFTRTTHFRVMLSRDHNYLGMVGGDISSNPYLYTFDLNNRSVAWQTHNSYTGTNPLSYYHSLMTESSVEGFDVC